MHMLHKGHGDALFEREINYVMRLSRHLRMKGVKQCMLPFRRRDNLMIPG